MEELLRIQNFPENGGILLYGSFKKKKRKEKSFFIPKPFHLARFLLLSMFMVILMVMTDDFSIHVDKALNKKINKAKFFCTSISDMKEKNI